MFLLDTDVLSALAKRRRDPQVERWLARRRDDELFLSVVSVGEIERGIALQRGRDPAFAERLASWLERLLAVYAERALPFDLAAARRWGELSARIGHGGADLQIAAIALTRGLTVVTRNGAHFAPTGVAVVDPFEAEAG
jgi:predicted nucleic acid-binding protein